MTPNRIVWDSLVKEIILSINSGQIGILPNGPNDAPYCYMHLCRYTEVYDTLNLEIGGLWVMSVCP
uniref:Uncharacterized protein n=1 Tax=Nelumbo nucifera TaxID=4432 RepID=A0A822ZFE9_NELNU|nr:TPA_asm: hypothetical protein HUJ06_016069 [Nelumbo nucifera]